MTIFKRVKQPAPRWFVIANRIWSPTENTIIALLMLNGFESQAPLLLGIKLVSSYLRNTLDAILTEDKNENDEQTGSNK